MNERVQPGDVVTFKGGRCGHIVRVVEGRFASVLCGEVLVYSAVIPPGTRLQGVWRSLPGTPVCRTCHGKVSTRKAWRFMPDIVRRASFGQRVPPTHVPALAEHVDRQGGAA